MKELANHSQYSLTDTSFRCPKDFYRNHIRSLKRTRQHRPTQTQTITTTTYDSALTPVGNWAWGDCLAVDIRGHYAYIGNGFSLQILDITNLDAPVLVGEYVTSELIYDVRLRGDSMAFVCNWEGFLIFDVSNPTAPEKVSEIPLWAANRVIPTDSFAYVASGGVFSVVDITDLRNPHIRSQAAGDGGDGQKDQLALFNGRYVYLGDPESPGLIYAYDCHNPDHIQYLPNLNIGWYSFSVYQRSGLLIVGASTRIKTYSLADPANPILLGVDTLSTGYPISGVTVSDFSSDYPFEIAFAMSGGQWLFAIDIGNPFAPQVLDSLSILPTPVNNPIFFSTKVQAVIGVAAPDGLYIVDTHDPHFLQAKSFFLAGGDGPLGVAVQDHYAYLAVGSGGLAILDIANPTRPIRVGSLYLNGTGVMAVAVEGSYAYVVGHDALSTIDVSNPRAPVLTGWVSVGSSDYNPLAIAVEKNRAYVSVWDSAVVVIDLSNPSAPSRIGTYLLRVDDLVALDSLLYLARTDTLDILDVADPQHPVRLSALRVGSEAVAVQNNLIYSSSSMGLAILDASNPSSPKVVGVNGSALGTGVAVSGGYVYLSLGNNRITAVDVLNPVSPGIVGVYNSNFDAGVAAQDRFIYLCEVSAGLQIFENKLVTHDQHYSFDAGWNMISVPSSTGGTRNDLFPSSTSRAFTYQSNYIAKDTLVPGKGYWLKFASAQSILLPDVPIYSESVAVVKGWNMIGSISVPVAVSQIGSNPGNIVTSPFFGLGGSEGYQIADTIQPSKGYWVRVSQAATLIVPGEVLSGKSAPSNRIQIVPTSERPPSIPDFESAIRRSHLPWQFALEQNYPNPFNPTTAFRFQLPAESHVTLKIYNVLGQNVATVVNEVKKAGEYRVTWDAGNLPSGVYCYQLSTPKEILTKKLLILR